MASHSDDEHVIDAEVVGDGGEPLPVPRAAIVPQAGAPRAVVRRRESELATVRNVAVATAGGVVAGAASVAIVKAAKQLAKPSNPGMARRRRKDVVGSRTFLVDVHLLKPGR